MEAVLRGFREKGLSYLVVGPFAIVLAFPFYVMVITAFKQQRDFYDLSHTPYWFHKGPTLSNARFLFDETPYTQWLENTAIIGVLVVLITLLLAVPAGYALARLSGRLGQSVGVGIFLTYLVPPTLLFLPLSRVIAQYLHLSDRLWALVVVYPSFTIPFAVWLLMGFFKNVPFEIEEAALVDGATRRQAVFKVVLPISRAGLAAAGMFAFAITLQAFLYPLVFTSSTAVKPVTHGVVTDLVRGDLFYWGSLMAGAVFAGLPVAILFNFFMDDFVEGITAGSTK